MCNCKKDPCAKEDPCNLCKPKPCKPKKDCTCPVKDLSSDCVIYKGDDLACSGVVSGLTLTETLIAIDAYICEAIDDLIASINLVNVGAGKQIYAGIDALGRRKIRTLTSTNGSVTITENDETIDLSVSSSSVCIESLSDRLTIIEEDGCFKLRLADNCITSDDNSVTIVEKSNGCFDLSVNSSQTFIDAGENVLVTGNGTESDPFIINSALNEIDLVSGTTTTVIGDGSNLNPYKVEMINLQKVISTFPYTLTSADDKYTIFVDNGSANVIINVPNGLVNNFSVVFIQEGAGNVTIQASGTATLLKPSTLQNVIKDQNYWALIEKKLATDNYFLSGSLKLV